MAICGILNINKPAGISSRDAVNRVERLTSPAKAGHAGTLDPLATGVLVVCAGTATRLIQYVQRMPKRYQATFLLGRRSPTDDVEGEVTLLDAAPEPTQAAIEAVLSQFVGQIQQRPPPHSAVKVAGRRAYALARRGQPLELAPRTVTIHSLAVRRYAFPELEMDIECGSGTYVRSLGRDLAEALGTAAVMSALQRTAVGTYRVADAIRVEGLSADSIAEHLQPALTAVADLPRVQLTDSELAEVRHGRPVALRRDANPAATKVDHFEWAAIDPAGQLAAILREKHTSQLWPVRNFS